MAQVGAKAITEVLVRRPMTPIRAYFKGSSFAAGITFFSNYIVGFGNSKPPISPINDPQSFAIANVSKSLYFGLLWPAIPFVIMKKPKDYFVLGGSFDINEKEGYPIGKVCKL